MHQPTQEPIAMVIGPRTIQFTAEEAARLTAI